MSQNLCKADACLPYHWLRPCSESLFVIIIIKKWKENYSKLTLCHVDPANLIGFLTDDFTKAINIFWIFGHFFALIWKLIFKTSLTALKQNANNHRVAKITRTLLYLIYLIWYTVPVLPQKIWNLKVFSFFFKNWAKILKGILLH